jgi:tRNA uracil 4-sulfurtransferase
METDTLIIHYNEIAIKGKNRPTFEQALVRNIKHSLQNQVPEVKKVYGKIIATLSPNHDKDAIASALKKTPGIAYFAFSNSAPLDINKIQSKILSLLESKTFNSFKLSTKRSNKKFPQTSNEINNLLGQTIKDTLNKPVDLTNPDLELFLEISDKESHFYTEKYPGLGGLPTNTTGTLLSSLSGGIDSPVASYQMMKRGAKIIFAHIYNKTINSPATLNKIKSLVKTLSQFQNESKLYIIPFEEIQKAIIANIPSDFRMIIYRRFMNRLLNSIAQKENAKAIITGDNLGQVASQTPENLICIHDSSKLPIFSPLIGHNKQEIINIAKEIQTYETSILPHEDCCSYMIAKSPATKASLNKIIFHEKKIQNQEELIAKAINNSELFTF